MPDENNNSAPTQDESGSTSEQGSASPAITMADLEAVINKLENKLLAEVDVRNQGLAANLSSKIKALSTAKKKAEKVADESKTPQGNGTEKQSASEQSASTEAPKAESAPPLQMQALQTELKDLKAKLKAEGENNHRLNVSNALNGAIAASGAQNPALLYKVLSADYSGRVQRSEGDGAFYLTDGDRVVPLQDAVTQYLGTDEGKVFVKPSGVNGSGAKETSSNSRTEKAPEKAKNLDGILSQISAGQASFRST